MPTKSWNPSTRDIDIIRTVHLFKLLRSRDHILPLFDGRKRVIRRLQTLTERGYLFCLDRRPNEQAIYTIGNRGLILLRDRFDVAIPRNPRQPDQARRLKVKHIEHTLDLADVVLAIELACRRRDDVRFLSQAEILDAAPHRTRAEARKLGGRPLYLETEVHYEGERSRRGTEADWLFGLHPKGKDPKYFFLEVDRGTESVVTSNLDKASIIRKMLVYLHAWRGTPPKETNLYEAHFGFRHARTLFVATGRYETDGDERVQNFVKANEMITAGRGHRLFLFTTKESFLGTADVLSAPLLNGMYERTILID